MRRWTLRGSAGYYPPVFQRRGRQGRNNAMDPVCHTLVGASLGATGLKDRTRCGMATLLIAANLPDIDVVAHYWGRVASYEIRRGWTHGLPAMVILPLLLAACMYAYCRWRAAPRGSPPASLRWLVLLSFTGVATHPALDWLNNYGMRWLMPFVDRWFYGDTLFIIDPIVWVALAAGLIASRFVDGHSLRIVYRPAVLSLAFVSAYIAVNFGLTQLAERATRAASREDPAIRIMASPVPLAPFQRSIVLEYEDHYRLASWQWLADARYTEETARIAKGNSALLAAARATSDGRRFLHWARFPYVVAGNNSVRLADARYVRDIDNPRVDGFGVVTVPLNETVGARPADSRSVDPGKTVGR